MLSNTKPSTSCHLKAPSVIPFFCRCHPHTPGPGLPRVTQVATQATPLGLFLVLSDRTHLGVALLCTLVTLFFVTKQPVCSGVPLKQYDVLGSLGPLMHWNGPNDRLIRGSGQDWLIKKKRPTIRVTALSGIRTRAPFVCQSRKNMLREANCKRQKPSEEGEVISLYFKIEVGDHIHFLLNFRQNFHQFWRKFW